MLRKIFLVYKNHGLKPALKTLRDVLRAGRVRRQHRAYYEASFPKEGNRGQHKAADYRIIHTDSVRLHPSYEAELARLAADCADCADRQGRPALVYTDSFDAAKGRLNFRPDYAPDNLTDYNYIGNCVAVREDLMDGTAWEAAGRKDMWRLTRYLCGRAEENGGVCHIAKPLYEENIKKETTQRTAGSSTEETAGGSTERTAGSKGQQPQSKEKSGRTGNGARVSILIPNRDHRADLKRCLESVLFLTDYEDYQILILENNSTQEDIFAYYKEIEEGCYRSWQEKNRIDIRILVWKEAFNYSAINNYGAAKASGELLVLLNNDTKVISGGWLKAMAQYALRENTGAVGACLLYPDKTVQHAGIIVGIGPDAVAVHQSAGVPFEEEGAGCGIHHVQNCSAVTGACLMVKKKLYEAAGGLDEELAVAYNDVDFCLKLRAKGLRNVYVPKALLFHYESVSRGRDDTGDRHRRFLKEAAYFRTKWKDVLEEGDPYYNPNLSRSVPWTIKQ